MKHIFVIQHKPAYSYPTVATDGLAFDIPARDAYWNVLVNNQVEGVFSAHNHEYWRAQPTGKTWQVIAGNGGTPIDAGLDLTIPSSGGYYGFTVVSVTNSGRVFSKSYGRDVPAGGVRGARAPRLPPRFAIRSKSPGSRAMRELRELRELRDCRPLGSLGMQRLPGDESIGSTTALAALAFLAFAAEHSPAGLCRRRTGARRDRAGRRLARRIARRACATLRSTTPDARGDADPESRVSSRARATTSTSRRVVEFYAPALAAAFNSRRQEVDDDDAPPPSTLAAQGFPALETLLWPRLATARARFRGSRRRSHAAARRPACAVSRPTSCRRSSQMIEVARHEIARVSTLGIAGFDAPDSGDAMIEAAAGARRRASVCSPMPARVSGARSRRRDARSTRRWSRAAAYLEPILTSSRFDRLAFITRYRDAGGARSRRVAPRVGGPGDSNSARVARDRRVSVRARTRSTSAPTRRRPRRRRRRSSSSSGSDCSSTRGCRAPGPEAARHATIRRRPFRTASSARGTFNPVRRRSLATRRH